MGNKSKYNARKLVSKKNEISTASTGSIVIAEKKKGKSWYAKVRDAIKEQNKDKLENLLNLVNKKTSQINLLTLHLFKWENNIWDGKKWSLGRETNNEPLCKLLTCSGCPLFKVEGVECCKAEFYDKTRGGDKTLMVARLTAAQKQIPIMKAKGDN